MVLPRQFLQSDTSLDISGKLDVEEIWFDKRNTQAIVYSEKGRQRGVSKGPGGNHQKSNMRALEEMIDSYKIRWC